MVIADLRYEVWSSDREDTSVGVQRKNSTTPVGTGDGETAESVALSDTVDPGITLDAVVLDSVTNPAS